jgi:hypothetical protein
MSSDLRVEQQSSDLDMLEKLTLCLFAFEPQLIIIVLELSP